MKKIQKYMMIALVGAIAMLTAGCQKDTAPEEEFSKNYDIPWKISRITNVTPIEAAPGSNITLTGENLGTDLVLPSGFLIGTLPCVVVSQAATTVVVTVPMAVAEPMDVSVRNLHNRTFVYEQQFTPVL
ncbi:MAG: IPT/TIG domain-containing protein [Prevotellaceae bacterium]|jgi:hypothetical protein|nr:IPT/TIG domain-containing protein [Prevotellaceae bacterium]